MYVHIIYYLPILPLNCLIDKEKKLIFLDKIDWNGQALGKFIFKLFL